MKTVSALLFVGIALTAGTAQADDRDWSGFYAGLSLGHVNGRNTYEYSGDKEPYDLNSENFGGIHGGYRWDYGTYVVGAELAYSRITTYEKGYEGEYEYDGVIDMKVSLGYELPSSLVYLNLGASFADFKWDTTESDKVSGPMIGIGYTYALTDQFTIGAEYNYRRFKGDSDEIDFSDSFRGRVKTFEIRADYRF